MVVVLFAEAIATAEGFYVPGSKSQRQNNPGNLSAGGSTLVFSDPNAGWQALYTQVNLMFSGGSAYYNPNMTIQQVGYIYADGLHDPQGAANWSGNVASELGVTTTTTLAAIAQMSA